MDVESGGRIFSFVLAPIPDSGYVNLYGRDVTDRWQADAQRQKFVSLADQSMEFIGMCDMNFMPFYVNQAGMRMVGLPSREQACATPVKDFFFPEDQHFIYEEFFPRVLREGRAEVEIRFRHFKTGEPLWMIYNVFYIRDAEGKPAGLATVSRNITDRKRVEEALRRQNEERAVTNELLRLANRSNGTRELIRAATVFFHQQSGCEAVGIRLRDGDDFPYYEARGFPEEFLRLENSLCVRDADGAVQRDCAGNAVMACMCGNVICGRFDPAKPFFTPNGSFWSNDTTRLLATTTDADRQTPTRNRCNGEGYESVALLALRCGEERLGLLQLNDRRKGMFTPEIIAFWEKLAGYLAIALGQSRAVEALHESEQQFRTLADSIPNLAWWANGDGYITWYNRRWYEYTGTTAEQMEGWGWQSVHDPEVLPKVLQEWKASIATGAPFDMTFPLRGR